MALVQNAQPQQRGAVTKADIEPGDDDPRRPHVAEEGFEPITFRAKGRNQRIVRVPANRFTTLNGEIQHVGGIAYEFAPTGDFVARSSNVANFLRSRPAFNLEFWEVGNEPHAAPDPSVVLDKVQTALMELDLDALEDLLAKETASHNRKIVVDQIKSAQRKIAAA
jgi:hypothetical protein